MIDLPVYEITLPVKNETIECSPLIVKEEKNIAAAKQTGTKSDSYLTFLKILDSKIKLNVLELCETDLIYCMLQLRKHSIGDMINLSFMCPHAKKEIKISFNLDDIKLKGTCKSKHIKESDYSISLQVPHRITDLSSAIKTIETSSEKIDFAELLPDSKEEFMDSLPLKLRDIIQDGCESLLHYEYDLEYESDTAHKIPVRSAEDFFTLFFVI